MHLDRFPGRGRSSGQRHPAQAEGLKILGDARECGQNTSQSKSLIKCFHGSPRDDFDLG